MENKIRKLMIGLIFPGVTLFTACSRVKPEPITETSLDSLLSIPLSTLVIPIRYEVKELENLFNLKIQRNNGLRVFEMASN
jgi:hypothetical protein